MDEKKLLEMILEDGGAPEEEIYNECVTEKGNSGTEEVAAALCAIKQLQKLPKGFLRDVLKTV